MRYGKSHCAALLLQLKNFGAYPPFLILWYKECNDPDQGPFINQISGTVAAQKQNMIFGFKYIFVYNFSFEYYNSQNRDDF